MPLRDHFRPPLDDLMSWEALHGQWPAMIVLKLRTQLPPEYVAMPRVHHGARVEFDVAAYQHGPGALRPVADSGGVATAVWAPPLPTFAADIDLSAFDEYEVLIYDTRAGRRLVAAIEIVSPANKDRPEARRVFVAKCVAMLHHRVAVTIVDLVTTRQFNLFRDILEFIGKAAETPIEGPTYAVTCRLRGDNGTGRFESWGQSLSLGEPLPTLPLWLSDELAIQLNLEASYEETCEVLRIP